MNDHYGMIIHRERTQEWRREAGDSRLLAEAKAGRQSLDRGERPARLASARRLLGALAGMIPGR